MIYIYPNRYGFKTISYFNKVNNTIFAILFIFIIGLQTINIIKIHLQEKETNKNITDITHEIEELKNKYNALIRKNNNSNGQKNNVTYINETIQRIMSKNGITINKLDWNLDQGRSVDLKIINHSKPIFNVISDLNKLPSLKFNTLILTKSEKNKQLEFNANLALTEYEE